MTLRYKREDRDVLAQSTPDYQWYFLRVATDEDYDAMPEGKPMVKCWFCDKMIEPVVQYYGPNMLAHGCWLRVHASSCRERQSKLPFDPNRVMYDS